MQNKENADTSDETTERMNKLLEANLSTDLEYNFQIGNEIAKQKKAGGLYPDIQDLSNYLLKSYAILYDKIIQGYANKTREIRVQDNESEKGYRVLTQGEELNSLNIAFKKYADGLEAMAEQEPKIKKAMDKYMEQLAGIGVNKPPIAQAYYDNAHSGKKRKPLPKNLSQTLVHASAQFVNQYALFSKNTENRNNLLQNIKMFD